MARHKRAPRTPFWQQAVAVAALVSMPVGMGLVWHAAPAPRPAPVAERTVERTAEVSRSQAREPLSVASGTVDGTWLGGDNIDAAQMTAIPASNATVKAWVNGPDKTLIPTGFQPDHATGDTGLAYSFSQCTWWAYTRRHQLGLPVGSRFGNGAQWAGLYAPA